MFIKDAKNFNLPEAEEKVLDYWKKNRIFERSLERRQIAPRQNSGRAKGKSRKFVFYEGPPTANGRPGIHHVLARAFKDVILRYKTMRGYYVPRRAGWDTHGLPVEIQVEKELGLKSKKDIEKYGIAEFNRKCRESVWKHKDEWERLTERMGFWLDMKNPYVTYEKDYIETLWWIVAQFWKKKLLYKGNRIVNWCPRCGTGLSSHEMAQGYKTVTDEAAYIKFKLKRQATRDKRQVLNAIKGDVFILSWTTTPWTLPGNVALAVGEKINYVMLEVEKLDVGGPKKGEVLILAKERLEALGIQGKIIKEVKGKDLIGLVYQPLFEVKPLESKNSYKIYGADFVTTTEGTGVVHTAVMYGEDDYKLGVKMGLPQHHTVDEAGKFTKDVKGLAGLYVKAKETEKKIFDYLTKNNNLLKTESYKHEYPHCWRCSTPLLYYARVSWFVAMAKLKKKLWKNNETINWTPEHVKNGRFGEWLREVKDWNFSRERYWGTPLPIWECKKCEHREVVGGIDELSMLAKEDSNVYWAMRHGEAEGNVRAIIDSGNQHFRLSTIGRDQAKRAAEKLKAKSIDIIFASDLTRTRETAGIVAKVLGIKRVVYDKRLREINLSSLSGQPVDEYRRRLPIEEERFSKHAVPGAESLRDVRRRSWEFLSEVGKKFKRKKILFVSHEDTIWMLAEIANGWSEKITADKKEKNGEVFMGPAEFLDFKVKSLPRDETGLVDLHRPYVDEVVLRCVKCKGEMRRVKELADVWFDSGSMPLAQSHFPFDCATNPKSQKSNLKECLDYPADYIAEAVDQTRGWFYTLLAVATVLGKEAPYKNVICLGHINDKFGQKMSKSKGNIVDPWAMAEKYGMDAVRWYFYTATPPGEPKNFDEQELAKTYRKFHLILWNSLVFYRTYGKTFEVRGSKFELKNNKSNISNKSISSNILDQWILIRLEETIKKATKNFDHYQIREAAQEIEKLTDDLSRWYIRRSRRRLQKSENKKDYEDCSQTLRYVLSEILKMTAPFNPFFSEILWNVLGEKDSVHLVEWPATRSKIEDRRSKLLREMEEVRRLAALGLAKRAEAGIKVRQPLAALKIKNKKEKIKISERLIGILAEEVNVKKVVFDSKINPPDGGEIELDTNITAELREEGVVRELIRAVQELRQKAGLSAKDVIVVMLECSNELRKIVENNESLLKKEVGAKVVEYKKSGKFKAEAEIKVENENVWLGLRKI